MPHDPTSPTAETAHDVETILARARPLDGRDPNLGLTLSQQARDLAARAGDPARLAEADLSVGMFAWRLGNYDLALAHLAAALGHYDERSDRRGQARCHGNLGNVHYSRAQYADALRHFLQTLRLSQELRDALLELNALNAAGNVYEDLGDYPTALKYRLRTLRHAQRLDDPALSAAPLTNLGNTYQRRRQFAEALACYQRAGSVARASGNARNAMMAHLNSGSALTELARPAEAVPALEQALALAKELGAPTTQVWALAGLIRARADLDAAAADPIARAHYAEARAIADTLEAPDCAVGLRRAYGEILVRAGRLDEARDVLLEALESAERHTLAAACRDLHELLADLLERHGDPAGALRHFREHHAAERRLHGEAQEQRARALAEQHQVEQARADARDAQALNEELTRKNAELLAMDGERTALLSLLREQAERDDLTGLANRRAYRAHLDRALARAGADGAGPAVILADVDCFKSINDRFSHAVGDAVLREVAALLGGACRGTDVAARYGGEEFALLLHDVTRDQAIGMTERARSAVERHDWSGCAPGLSVTLSFGVCADASSGNAEGMLALADERLYEAKRAGRNRVR